MATTKTTAKKPAARKPAAKKAAPRATAKKAPAPAKTTDRVLHVPLGATLVARDAVTEVVTDTTQSLRSTFSSTDSVGKELQLRRKRLEAEMKRFERRGATARNRIEKDLKGRRTRLEKDLKARRSDAESLVQSGISLGQEAATRVSDRVPSVR